MRSRRTLTGWVGRPAGVGPAMEPAGEAEVLAHEPAFESGVVGQLAGRMQGISGGGVLVCGGQGHARHGEHGSGDRQGGLGLHRVSPFLRFRVRRRSTKKSKSAGDRHVSSRERRSRVRRVTCITPDPGTPGRGSQTGERAMSLDTPDRTTTATRTQRSGRSSASRSPGGGSWDRKGQKAFKAAFAGYMLDAFDLIVLTLSLTAIGVDVRRRHGRDRRAVDGDAVGVGRRRRPRRRARRPDRPRAHADAVRRRLLALHVPVGPRVELRDADGLPRLPGDRVRRRVGRRRGAGGRAGAAASRAARRSASSRARGRSAGRWPSSPT